MTKRQRKKAPAKKLKDQGNNNSVGRAFGFGANTNFGSVSSGGFMNFNTGSGVTGVDKSQGGFFQPTWVTNRTELETIYVESWAAKKFIDIPIDDMFIRYRQFNEGVDEDIVDAITQQEKKFRVRKRMAAAMKSGRLYGTGLLLIVSAEQDLREPLDVTRIKPGDLRNLIATDRYSCTILEKDKDHMSPTYGEPLIYHVDLKEGRAFDIHATRVLRFDGIQPLSTDGWYNYYDDWGVSEVIPVITSIMQDAQLTQGIAHLSNEASIPVQKIHAFQDALEAGNSPDEMSLMERAQLVNMTRSIYRTIFMDKEDEFQRQEVSFAGLPDLLDRFAKRLSSVANIPATRFHGQSPLGMNATGDSDMQNHSAMVNAMQVRMLDEPVYILDQILLRDAGMQMPEEGIEYTWLNLIDQSEVQQTATAKTKMEVAMIGLNNGIIEEEEARNIVDGDTVVGNLKDFDEYEKIMEEQENAAQSEADPSAQEGREGISGGPKKTPLATVVQEGQRTTDGQTISWDAIRRNRANVR